MYVDLHVYVIYFTDETESSAMEGFSIVCNNETYCIGKQYTHMQTKFMLLYHNHSFPLVINSFRSLLRLMIVVVEWPRIVEIVQFDPYFIASKCG